jgi:translation initiation factor IF-1
MKDELLRCQGTVTLKLRNSTRVVLDNGHTVLGPLSGRMMLRKILVVPGDRVTVEVSPYDPERGRVIRRNGR